MFWANFRCDEHNLWSFFCVYFFTSTISFFFCCRCFSCKVRSLVSFVSKFLEFLQFMSVKIISHKSQSNDEKGNLIEVDFIMIRNGQLQVERDKCIKNYISLNCTMLSILSLRLLSSSTNCNSIVQRWGRKYYWKIPFENGNEKRTQKKSLARVSFFFDFIPFAFTSYVDKK